MGLQIVLALLFFGCIDCINHCKKVNVSEEFWKNEGAAVIYIMKNSQQNWLAQVTSLVHLQNSLYNIGVSVHLTIATNKTCTAFKNIKYLKVDTNEIWNTLEHHNDYPEAYIIDRCGKVTYHVIFPWSLVKWFPFVKGAILSTFFDKPCGSCEIFHPYQVDPPQAITKVEEVKVYPKYTKKNIEKSFEGGPPPIEVIIKEKHRHEGSNEIYEYTGMELGNRKYHRHFHSLDDDEFTSYDENYDFQIIDTGRALELDEREKLDDAQEHFKHSNYKAKRIITKSDEEYSFPLTEPQHSDIDKSLQEMTTICCDTNNSEESDSKYYEELFHNLLSAMYSSNETKDSNESEKKETMSHHYEKLNNWISYIV